MSDPHAQREELKPINVAMVFVVIATILAVCFFTSPPPDRTPDGASPWAEGAILKALTDALAFDFKIPTPLGLEIKQLAFGVGSGLAAILVAGACFAARRSREHEFTLLDDSAPAAPEPHLKRQIEPLQGAQLLFGGVVVLSFLSSLWAPMPEVAFGGSVLLLGQCLWVFAIRFGFNARACRAAAIGMIVILSAAATLAVVYYYERNQTMRPGYPIGNPLFFAACMIPAVLICVCWIVRGVRSLARGHVRALIGIMGLAVVLVPMAWGIKLADPRSTYVGLGAGLASIMFFAVRGAVAKISVIIACLVLVVVGYFSWLEPLLDHRPETIRTRLYGWTYAQELIAASPIVGHGQGGFALLGDALAVNDVADDPRALHARLAHAHNEWLETGADLGSIGLVMTLGCFALTFWAGVRALRQISNPNHRWLLIGLLASLAALMVEECADVALRIAGLPTIFYSVVGMIWALAGSVRTERATSAARATKLTAQGFVSAGAVVLGLMVSTAAVLDFHASRALHDFHEKLQQRQWDAAVEEVQFATRFRLSPSRKLTSFYSQAWCHLRIAEESLRDFQAATAQAAEAKMLPSGDALRSYAQLVIEHARSAIELTDTLAQHTPNYYGMQRVAGSALELIRHVAELTGDLERADQFRLAAVQALRRELSREPHDADLAWHILELSPELGLTGIIELICPPMRYHDVDLRYFQLVQSLAQNPNFDVEFQPLLTPALTQLIAKPLGSVEVSYAAQKLRIAAWVAVGRGDPARGKDYAQHAVSLAEKQKDRFPIAHAIAYRELAHFGFLADPRDVRAAIEAATMSNSLLADSHEAAPIKARTSQRLAMYYLALGDEPAAEELMPNLTLLKPEARQAELATAYFSLCQLVLTLPEDRRPGYFRDRVDRLYELSQSSQTAPEIRLAAITLKAQAALRQGDAASCARYWREALELGFDPAEVLPLAEQAAQAHPQEQALQQLIQELEIVLTGPMPEVRNQ